MANSDYDAIVIGAGHNGLVCAAYLAKAGLKTIVFEQWHRAGGCVQTEELIPDFKINPCSVDHIVIQSTPIIKELELESRFGLKYINVDPMFSAPFPDGKYFLIHKEPKKTCQSIAENISPKDAENYRDFVQFWMKAFDVIFPLMFAPQYPMKSTLLSLNHGDRKNLFKFALKDEDTLTEMMKNIIMSPTRMLNNWFETEYVKAPIAWMACSSGIAPSQSGMGMLTILPMFGHYGGCKRPEGGSGMLSQALVSLIEHYGGKVRVEAPVAKVVVEGGQAKGVILENGETIEAKKAVISAMSPKRLFCDMIDAHAVPDDVLKEVEKLETRELTNFKVDLALDGLPKFEKCKDDPNITVASPMICPSVEYLERAFDDVKYREPPKEPGFWAAFPTTLDPTLAPDGKHILYLSALAPRKLSGNRKWEDVKEAYAETIIDKLEEAYLPDLRKRIIGRHVASPDDLKKRIGDTNPGHIDCYLDQNAIFRPTRKLSGYRTPITGLYISGPGTHPGGGVGGIPGRNTAQVVMQDMRGKPLVRDMGKYAAVGLEMISALLSRKSK